MTPAEYQAVIEQVKAHWASERFREALALVDGLLRESPLSAELWVKRGNLLQLTPDDGPLEEIEQALETACTLTPHFTEAQLELGHYRYAVQDAPHEALAYFERAGEQAEKALREALRFQIKCLVEMDQEDRARDVLAEARRRFFDDSDFTEYDIHEIAEFGL